MKQEWLKILGIQSEEEIDKVNWEEVSYDKKLSEYFIKKYSNKVNWNFISKYQELSEKLIEKYSDKVNWYFISQYQKMSEPFIEKFADEVNWGELSYNKKLSEDFIEKYSDKVNWKYISIYQKLSEEFIEKFSDKVNWDFISKYQKLSESFIEKYSDKVNWYSICKYQKLSETFIEKHSNKVVWYYISKYQKLSPEFMGKHNLSKPENNWLYATAEEKKQAIKDCGKYEIDGDYVIAYKSTKRDGISYYNLQYVYEVGKVYESHCDCNIDEENSFGLSAWTKEGALEYYSDGELYKVRIHIDDIGALVKDGNKLRCFKLEVIEKIQ